MPTAFYPPYPEYPSQATYPSVVPIPNLLSTHNAPLPTFPRDYNMHHPVRSMDTHHNSRRAQYNITPHLSPANSVSDCEGSLQPVSGTRWHVAGQGQGQERRNEYKEADPLSTESEEAVAESIVRSRKSWKTIKGRSEPVWPPHLERALVQALLQYKPQDSRYVRALGRFPKRNRYISDFIFETTGVRRTPKQVGSRLQQLKDISCGKMLLNHVASRSMSPTPSTSPSVNDVSSLPCSNALHNMDSVVDEIQTLKSEGSQSPVSPLRGMGPEFDSSSATQVTLLDPYATHVGSALTQGSWYPYNQCMPMHSHI
ncbi:uncharacterized protein FOMMEDRAFT_151017 [Fomitiporia mediterranea MF3/22]|uniref:uncharacterized protein n=1 Tax=Fomitiporia mediterranea (strain MF3/22) TaxID=694068 RepID=UPI0004407503|nr:uncharacterized protein FOMMEDRAFT_151017 [Fomitiporia mediterranea MF3/22]EJD08270.1 hypothetical protein FOMMEDRAFT_151017 [Fomitiporia mediterranea MF3/22]